MAHFFIISLLCIIAYIVFRRLDVHPIFAGGIIIFEIIIYVGIAMGLFANDIWWLLKTTIINLSPSFIKEYFYNSLLVTLPNPGSTYVMPIVAPLAGIFLTYGSNVIFQFLHEQRQKVFERDVWHIYISRFN